MLWTSSLSKKVSKKFSLVVTFKSPSMISRHILGCFFGNGSPGTQIVKFAPIIIFEGILSFYDEDIRNLMDLKIFVLTDDDVRLGRRLIRDVKERGRTPESVLTQYNTHVKKSYDEFIKPTMKYADVIIPRGRTNTSGIELIIENINMKLRNMGISPSISGKQIKYTFEEPMMELMKKGDLKNVIFSKGDEDTMNEIVKNLMLQKDTIFNKYIFL